MNINLMDVGISIVKSILLGIVLVVLGVFLSPDKITISLLKRIKPNIINYKNPIFSKILSIILYGFTNQKNDDISVENNRIGELETLNRELDIQQKNLFIIDSLDGILDTIKYLGIRHGINYYTLIEETTEYLLYYANLFTDTVLDDVRMKDTIDKIMEIEEKFSNFRCKVDIRKLEGEAYIQRIQELAKYQVDLLVGISKDVKALKKTFEKELEDKKRKINIISTKLVEDY